MNPAPINRRGPILRHPVTSGSSTPKQQTTSSVRTPNNKAPPIVRYNTLTTERIINTWKVKRTEPTKDIGFPRKEGSTSAAPKVIKNYASKQTLENQKSSTEVQRTVIETWKERRTPAKAQETAKKETSAPKPKTEVKKSGSIRKVVNDSSKEEKPKNEVQVNSVRSAIKVFEKNTVQKPRATPPKAIVKEEPKKTEKAVPKTKKEAATVKKTEEMVVVPIKKPSINVPMKPWSANSAPKDIITTSVRPSLKKAQSRDQIINGK